MNAPLLKLVTDMKGLGETLLLLSRHKHWYINFNKTPIIYHGHVNS